MNVVLKNLIALISEGAFGKEEIIEPMSQFKWNVLHELSIAEDVAPYVYKGLLRHDSESQYLVVPQGEEESGCNISDNGREKFSKALFNELDNIRTDFDITDIESQQLTYALKKYLLKDIVYKERHSIDTSKISLDFLSLILQNTNIILRKGIRLRGIVEIGIFLRTKGQYIDFVKVENWISRLKLRRMASLQASVLTSCFAFERDEFQYVRKFEKRAEKLTISSLTRVMKAQKRERQSGRYSIANCWRYYRYAPSEAFFKALYIMLKGLSEIEE